MARRGGSDSSITSKVPSSPSVAKLTRYWAFFLEVLSPLRRCAGRATTFSSRREVTTLASAAAAGDGGGPATACLACSEGGAAGAGAGSTADTPAVATGAALGASPLTATRSAWAPPLTVTTTLSPTARTS